MTTTDPHTNPEYTTRYTGKGKLHPHHLEVEAIHDIFDKISGQGFDRAMTACKQTDEELYAKALQALNAHYLGVFLELANKVLDDFMGGGPPFANAASKVQAEALTEYIRFQMEAAAKQKLAPPTNNKNGGEDE